MISNANHIPQDKQSPWEKRYSDRHKPVRITEFPAGVTSPGKVRIYARGNHYLLQFWDRETGKTQNQRIDGDLIEAIVQAREIDGELIACGKSGIKKKINHEKLIELYTRDLGKRCDADEITSNTVERYTSAINKHYLDFAVNFADRRYRTVNNVDREFQIAFSTYLSRKRVSSNGHENSMKKPMAASGQGYVMDCVKAMYEWASDPRRGGLLPRNFDNPFLKRFRRTTKKVSDRIANPDISVEMAVDLLKSCDLFQLPIFSSILLFGLRPSEIGWMFWENMSAGTASIQCHPELEYFTKGRRDKRVPIVDSLMQLFETMKLCDESGLVFHNRKFLKQKSEWQGSTFDDVVTSYQREVDSSKSKDNRARNKIRDRVIRQHGFISYDQSKREFDKLSAQLGWPSCSTLKDLRHLFSTSLENAGVPTCFRQYLMGHSFGNAPVVTYTHITARKLEQHYRRAVDVELADVTDAIELRLKQLLR